MVGRSVGVDEGTMDGLVVTVGSRVGAVVGTQVGAVVGTAVTEGPMD